MLLWTESTHARGDSIKDEPKMVAFTAFFAAFTANAANTCYNYRIHAEHAMYIYQVTSWPHFQWEYEVLAPLLGIVRNKQGRLVGLMSSLGFHERTRASLDTLTADVVESSKIEGEFLNPEQVRSSIARRLGLEFGGVKTDRHVEGVVEMVLDATKSFDKPLTRERLYSWHAALFPTPYSGLRKIAVAKYRSEAADPMEVVSGPIDREKVHFTAPSGKVVPYEMERFISWFENNNSLDLVLKAGIAHLWFVTIHPFEDGNGRIARAIADMMLTRSEQSDTRFYSMSAQIKEEQKDYYRILEQTQKGGLDITHWLRWFLECLERAIDAAETTVAESLARVRFWQSVNNVAFNDRQLKVLRLLLDNFEGKLTSSKWAKINRCSSDTALRDIKELIQLDILEIDSAGGRSASYSLKAGRLTDE
jgi:Fic family protein